MVMKRNIFYAILAATTLVACSDTTAFDPSETDISRQIRVGSIDTDGLVATEITTRAASTSTPAEQIDWLKTPLQEEGINVTYFLRNAQSAKSKALLKLDNPDAPEGGSMYSFKAYGTDGVLTENTATWLGNGGHMFQGVLVPKEVTKDTESFISNIADQSASDQSSPKYYDHLTRYLALPPAEAIQATVSMIRLPLRHRLARVLAFVLIDPQLGEVKLKDGTISFENVWVLESVDPTTHVPTWTEARKVKPHFMGYYGSIDANMQNTKEDFLVYLDKTTDTYIYPTESTWQAAHNAYTANPSAGKYEQVNYGRVPCFDIIVRPTYTNSAYVMYDEATGVNEKQDNKIDFVVKLNNGLSYQKRFVFDLDANYQTAVYLRIGREKVDYKDMGTAKWTMNTLYDGRYGVDNANGNRLSKAGGSWQRAYRIGTKNIVITDGNKYSDQYVEEERWKEMFFRAVMPNDINPLEGTEVKNHWGDYFVLDKDITIDVSEIPSDFIFTGHLDARGHTITLTDNRQSDQPAEEGEQPVATPSTPYLFDGLNGDYEAQEGQANCHKAGSEIIPAKGFRAEMLNLNVVGGAMFRETTEQNPVTKTGYIYNCKDKNGKVE